MYSTQAPLAMWCHRKQRDLQGLITQVFTAGPLMGPFLQTRNKHMLPRVLNPSCAT